MNSILTENTFTTELTSLIDEVVAKATVEWALDIDFRKNGIKNINVHSKRVKIEVYSEDNIIDTIDTLTSEYVIQDDNINLNNIKNPKDFDVCFNTKTIIIYY